jgi:DNA-binding transcriptional LysR family regulator
LQADAVVASVHRGGRLREQLDFRFAAYATPDYLQAAGSRALADQDWVLIAGLEDWFVPALWKSRKQALERAVLRTNSVTAAQRAAEAGMGVTALPCYRGDASPALVRAGSTFRHLDMELWIVTHPVLRRTTRVPVLMTWPVDERMPHWTGVQQNRRHRVVAAKWAP